MKSFLNIACSLLALTLLAGCSSTPTQHSSHSPSQPVHIEQQSPSARQLLAYYRQWQGTPYRFGGQSKRGIDCSGFVQNAYRDVLGMSVPRTTAMQAQAGVAVGSTEKQVGDILLFKTGAKQHHTGIYIGNGQFIHASTSQGVTLSNLSNPYWSHAYRQTRRVADL